MLYLLAVPAVLIGFTGASLFIHSVLHTTIWNPGTHGFSEILYAFSSAANNNGSAFAGITANTQWMNTTLGHHDARRPVLPHHPGARDRRFARPQADGADDVGHAGDAHAAVRRLVVAVILIIAGLTYFPALALGPILEHLSL